MPKRRLNHRRLFVTDPWETLDHPRDTTLRILQEAKIQGERVFWSDVKTIEWNEGKLTAVVQELLNTPATLEASDFKFSPPKRGALTAYTQLFYRTDPPVDLAFLFPLQLMALAKLDREIEIVNPLPVLFSKSEKLECLFDKKFTPATLISRDLPSMETFLKKQKTIVFKPLNSAQSKGVSVVRTQAELLSCIKRESSATLELPFVLQAYRKAILQGEKRTWWLDGKLLSYAQKLPKSGESVIQMDHGGSVRAAELTAREKRALPAIAKRLKESNVRWAAVDLIDGLITDYNFTSPGLIVQMEQVTGDNLAKKLLKNTI